VVLEGSADVTEEHSGPVYRITVCIRSVADNEVDAGESAEDESRTRVAKQSGKCRKQLWASNSLWEPNAIQRLLQYRRNLTTDRGVSAALTTRHPSIRKIWH
jgi:hypothetical protein